MDAIKTFKKMYDIDDDNICYDKEEPGARLIVSILLKAIVEAVNKSLPIEDRAKAFYWLILDDDPSDTVIRSIALKLINWDEYSIRRKIVKKIGQEEFSLLMRGAVSLPKSNRVWA
tara:strand:- start:255 stop:602 length:348 start_codon:yes stop_codon:yes gene_type:complete